MKLNYSIIWRSVEGHGVTAYGYTARLSGSTSDGNQQVNRQITKRDWYAAVSGCHTAAMQIARELHAIPIFTGISEEPKPV